MMKSRQPLGEMSSEMSIYQQSEGQISGGKLGADLFFTEVSCSLGVGCIVSSTYFLSLMSQSFGIKLSRAILMQQVSLVNTFGHHQELLECK